MTARVVRVADLAEQVRGVSYRKEDASPTAKPGYLPLLRAGNITDEGLVLDDLVFVPATRISQKQRIRRHDVVIAASSGSLDVVGKAAPAICDFEGGFGAFCKVLRPNSCVHPGYFAQFFKTSDYRRHVSALAAGANINNLRNEHLDEIQIPLPSLPEQRRIAEVLDRAEMLRAKRRTALAHLAKLTQAIFLELFGNSDTDARGWEVKSFGELVREFRYGTSNKSQPHGKPTLRIPNVVGGNIDLADLKVVPVGREEFERLRLAEGDILFVRTNGNPDFVGRCAVYDRFVAEELGDLGGECIFASYLIRARLDTDRIMPVFLREFMLGPHGRRHLRSRSKTSAGQFNINTESLGAIPIPVPPISLQNEFARRVAAVEKLKAAHLISLSEMDALFASLQHRAFRGGL